MEACRTIATHGLTKERNNTVRIIITEGLDGEDVAIFAIRGEELIESFEEFTKILYDEIRDKYKFKVEASPKEN